MSQQILYLGGDFEGYFYTHQSSPLAAGEILPGGNTHAVHIYRGKLENAYELQQFRPADHLDSSSLLLHNVNQIEASVVGADRKIYDFDQAVLNNLKVEQSWELNGKTYGIIRGKLYGKVKAATTPPNKGSKDPIPPPPPAPGPGGGSSVVQNRGCWDSLWKILRWLLLLLLLYVLLTQGRSCMQGCNVKYPISDSAGCCSMKDSLMRIKDSLQKKLDSSQLALDSIKIDRSTTDSLQAELDRRKDSAEAHTGKITISLMWSSKDDLDLALEQPDGEILYYNNKRDDIHEALFEIDRNRFGGVIVDDPIEHIYVQKPARGRYKIYVNWYKNRSQDSEVPYYLWVKHGDKIEKFEQSIYEARVSSSVKRDWNIVYEFEY